MLLYFFPLLLTFFSLGVSFIDEKIGLREVFWWSPSLTVELEIISFFFPMPCYLFSISGYRQLLTWCVLEWYLKWPVKKTFNDDFVQNWIFWCWFCWYSSSLSLVNKKVDLSCVLLIKVCIFSITPEILRHFLCICITEILYFPYPFIILGSVSFFHCYTLPL